MYHRIPSTQPTFTNPAQVVSSTGSYAVPQQLQPFFPVQLIPTPSYGQVSGDFHPGVDLNAPAVPQAFLDYCQQQTLASVPMGPVLRTDHTGFVQQPYPLLVPATAEPLPPLPMHCPSLLANSSSMSSSSSSMSSSSNSFVMPFYPVAPMAPQFVWNPQTAIQMTGPTFEAQQALQRANQSLQGFNQVPQVSSHHAPQVSSHHAPQVSSHHAPQRVGLSDEKLTESHMKMIEVGETVLDRASQKCQRDGKRWNTREKKQIDQLKRQFKVEFEYWKKDHRVSHNDAELLECYLDIVKEMSKQLVFESGKTKRRLKDLAHHFRTKILKYMRQEDFKAEEGTIDLDKRFEKSRSVLIYLRLFKNLQIQRFRNFKLTLSNPAEQSSDETKSLRGPTVVRNRCKRMPSFCPEAHVFDEFIHQQISSGNVKVDDCYICKDHKAQKNRNKERAVAGLLFYFVCPTTEDAEQLLRIIVTWCEAGNDEAAREKRQAMFRKHLSRACEKRHEDEAARGKRLEDEKRDRQICRDLCKGPWTLEQREKQKDMFHVTFALTAADQTPPSSNRSSPAFQPLMTPESPEFNYLQGCAGY